MMLEDDVQPIFASRILRLYTNESFRDARAWRGWLEESRGRLFFTDVGGYKFLVAPAPIAVRPRVPLRYYAGTKVSQVSGYEPDAPARELPGIPRWRVGLV